MNAAELIMGQTIESIKRTDNNKTVIIKTESGLEIEIWLKLFDIDPSMLEVEIRAADGEILWES